MFKVFFKKFFGPKYEMIFIGLMTMFLMYLATLNMEYNMPLDVYLLSNCILTTILTYQTITSNDNAQSFKRLFTYPLNDKEFKFKYIFCILIYSLFTRNIILFVMFCNMNRFTLEYLLFFMISTISITLLVISLFLIINKKKKITIFLMMVEIFFYILCTNTTTLLFSYIINIIISLILILRADIYDFMYAKKIKNRNISRKNTSFFTYIIRYFIFNKSYILSVISMIILACTMLYIKPELINKQYILFIFSILIYNTPLSIVISMNKSLQQKIKSYPMQIKNFYIPYFLAVFIIDYIIILLFLICSGFEITLNIELMHLLWAIENALIIVLLEYKLPVKNWNTERELWTNPRKYIAISILMSQAGILSIFL